MSAFFYARVSSNDQNLDRQLLVADGINEPNLAVFADKASGKDFDREQYKKMKSLLRAGDVLYVLSLDRFGRNMNETKQEWEDITKRIGADIVVIDMPVLDTRQNKDLLGNLITDLFLSIIAYVAESERQRIKERQRQGYEALRASGKWEETLCKPRLNIPSEKIIKVRQRQRAGEITVRQAVSELKCSEYYYWQHVKKLRAEGVDV